MALDLVTIVTSAVVGGFVSLATASWKVGREERARRSQAAKKQIREATRAVLNTAVQRVEDPTGPVLQETSGMSAPWRYTFASQVLIASDDLPRHRRWLVERRIRALVGLAVTDAARLAPAEDAVTAEETSKLLVRTMLKHKENPQVHDHGLLTLLGTNEATAKELRRLIRALKRLRNCW